MISRSQIVSCLHQVFVVSKISITFIIINAYFEVNSEKISERMLSADNLERMSFCARTFRSSSSSYAQKRDKHHKMMSMLPRKYLVCDPVHGLWGAKRRTGIRRALVVGIRLFNALFPLGF